MTIDKSHRLLVYDKMIQGESQVDAAASCGVSTRSIRRWDAKRRETGTIVPARKRKSIPGVIPEEVQEIIFTILSFHPTLI